MSGRTARFGTAGAFALGAVLLAFPVDAGAASFTVTNTNDSGAGSLRQAIADASASPGDDTVVIPAGLGTITLSSTINFTGTDLTTVQGNANTVSYPSNLVFNSGGTTPYSLNGLTIAGGQAANTVDGTLTITNSTLNVDSLGANTTNGILSISDTKINSGSGGANTTDGLLTVADSVVNSGGGTGLNTSTGELMLTRSQVTGTNDGIKTSYGDITINESQVSAGNDGVTTRGGQVWAVDSSFIGLAPAQTGVSSSLSSVMLVNATVTRWLSTGVSGDRVTLVYASIVGNGTAGVGSNITATNLVPFGSVLTSGADDCAAGTTTSQGYNYSNDGTCNLTATGDVQNGSDPGLGAAADNGGPGLTFLPQTASPLIDAIPAGACQDDGAAGITTDERGLPRPSGTGCDIGAVEVPAPAPTTTTSGPSTTTTIVIIYDPVPKVTPSFTG